MDIALIILTLAFAAAIGAFFFLKSKNANNNKTKATQEEIVDPKLEKQKQREEREKEKQRQKELKEAQKQKEREEKRNKNVKAIPRPMETAEHSIYIGSTCPTCVSFSEDGKYFLVTCTNRKNLLFDIQSLTTDKKPLHQLSFVDDTISTCDLINSGSKLEAVCGLDRSRSIQSYYIDVATGKTSPGSFNVQGANKLIISQLRVAKDHSYVVTFGDETYLSAFLPNGRSIIRNDTHQMHNYELSVSSDSQFFAVSSYTSEIIALGMNLGKDDLPSKATKAFTISGHSDSIVSIDFHQKQGLLATGSLDGHFNIVSTPALWKEGDDQTKILKSYETKDCEPVKYVRLNPVDDTIAVLTQSEKLFFYRDGKITKVVERPQSSTVDDMYWSPDGSRIVVLSSNSNYLYIFSK
ncbi:hypothetical protein TVAG_012540 [Trichomonas vaginalis G3]|uniref:Anaphase-promoting complex subunit 4 WD40 domain-containing protein n=1 Tax=Trichomonas vaginalis (strain ATCC PRA-98 / G3) TaxID=412133 RepID=A2E904_TRIV3|nr:transducin beta-like protein 2 family [Trichomonas vaginalis G3]EAY10888.1 hypothetical protein TVAG_012540 [Trichomonas vaginalis G3]KAI5482935.1 transducin beta-like protein 2 family [Trichomonas vaginalis G3]|eukprot:XP_001323111.1 hypothetical protein [Trichomonas vaginalis G3]